jgi:hypothetical protein
MFMFEPSDGRVVMRYRDAVPRDDPFAWDAGVHAAPLFADLGVRAERAAA